jgi:hypothetical protein
LGTPKFVLDVLLGRKAPCTRTLRALCLSSGFPTAPAVSAALDLTHLRNLVKFEMVDIVLIGGRLPVLPTSLHELKLSRCSSPPIWLASGSPRRLPAVSVRLSGLPNLRVCVIDGCPVVDDVSYDAETEDGLEELVLRGLHSFKRQLAFGGSACRSLKRVVIEDCGCPEPLFTHVTNATITCG